MSHAGWRLLSILCYVNTDGKCEGIVINKTQHFNFGECATCMFSFVTFRLHIVYYEHRVK